MIKQIEIKEFTLAELNDKLTFEIERLSKMKVTHAVSPIENPMKIKVVRRNIARIYTEINNKS